MPKAKRKCAKVDCRKYQPCPDHPQGWSSNKHPLPNNWKYLVRAVKRKAEYDGWKCRNCRKVARKGEVDHIINRARGGTDELANLQYLCVPCHRLKTLSERRYGIAQKKRKK